MTKIVFYRNNGIYYGFREEGHTGYGDAGDDVLCAALSAMTMLIINTIEVAYASDVDYTVDEGATVITVKSKAALPEYEEDERKRYAVSGIHPPAGFLPARSTVGRALLCTGGTRGICCRAVVQRRRAAPFSHGGDRRMRPLHVPSDPAPAPGAPPCGAETRA